MSGQQPTLGQLPVDPESDGSVGGPVPVGRLRAIWDAIFGAIGAVVGLIPRVLHHIGRLTGTAPVAGSGGTALFAVVDVLPHRAVGTSRITEHPMHATGGGQ